MNTVAAPGVMACHCGHGVNVGIPGQQLVQQPVPMQHIQQQSCVMACHCAHRVNVGISGQQLVQQHVRSTGAVLSIPGQLLQQHMVPMQHIQYIRQQPTVVVGVNPCHQIQMMQMQPVVVVGSVAAAPVLTTATTTTMMVPHNCQSSLAMVQMPMQMPMVGAAQVVSSMVVPAPGQVLGEVTVVGV
jgi:hypothetical protein